MDTAIINTHRMLEQTHGAVALAPTDQKLKLEEGVRYTEKEGKRFVNWTASVSPMISLARPRRLLQP
jgi:hypothetical protein